MDTRESCFPGNTPGSLGCKIWRTWYLVLIVLFGVPQQTCCLKEIQSFCNSAQVVSSGGSGLDYPGLKNTLSLCFWHRPDNGWQSWASNHLVSPCIHPFGRKRQGESHRFAIVPCPTLRDMLVFKVLWPCLNLPRNHRYLCAIRPGQSQKLEHQPGSDAKTILPWGNVSMLQVLGQPHQCCSHKLLQQSVAVDAQTCSAQFIHLCPILPFWHHTYNTYIYI